MKRQIDLPDCGRLYQQFSLLRQQSAVGGDGDLKTLSGRFSEKLFQQWMGQRLAFNMKVKIFCIWFQLLKNPAEFRKVHLPRRTNPWTAKGTVQVADVSDLKIDPFEQGHC